MAGSGEEIAIDGLRIWFERRGIGPPLVLLHGALSDSREWRRQVDGLCDDFSVVAWDAPGCGRSSDPPETFRLSDYADCLMAFLAEIAVDSPYLLGLSFGSGLALEFYRRYPAVPTKLVLASAYAGWAGSLPREVVEERLKAALEDSEKPPEQVVDAGLQTMFSAAVSSEVIREIAAIMRGFHPVGLRVMARSFAEADLRGVFPHIGIPTLFIHGEEDKRSPLQAIREFHASVPTSRLVIIPGAGHSLNVEAPEAFNTAVRGFLLEPDPRSH